jgi:hypothetical protein
MFVAGGLEGWKTSTLTNAPPRKPRSLRNQIDDTSDVLPSGIIQISSYVIAKLKQFQITVTFLETTTIRVTKHHHWLLKKAFEQSGMKVQFPAEPFNFDD